MKPCPFCFNKHVEFVEYESDDCVRVCIECSNCGLRGPGAEDDDSLLALEFWDELVISMRKVWNPE